MTSRSTRIKSGEAWHKEENEMAGRRRKPKIYDERCYRNFGEQPSPLEIQLGYGLIPLVDTEPNNSPLLEDITYLRNQIDGEYGLPLPSVHVRDNMCLEPYEYKIFLHGVEVGGYEKCNPHYVMCLDTGAVTEEISGEKTRDPAFDIDAVIIPYSEKDKAQSRGYVIPEWPVVIRCHLYKIIRKNITKFLDQSMVNKLVEKVRKTNPDVVSDVFFMKLFLVSDFKLVLNQLLDEEVSIRDMNTILETIADYLPEKLKPYELAEKIRQRLALSIISNYLEEDKSLHVIKVSPSVNEFIENHAYYPDSRVEIPYCTMDELSSKKFTKAFNEAMLLIQKKNLHPVLVCASSARILLAQSLHHNMPGVRVISDLELYTLKDAYPIKEEGELSFDDE